MVALWEAFYIENKHSDLDTLRVPHRSPTPSSKSNHFLGRPDDIWEARCTHLPNKFESSRGPRVPGVRTGLKNKYCLAR